MQNHEKREQINGFQELGVGKWVGYKEIMWRNFGGVTELFSIVIMVVSTRSYYLSKLIEQSNNKKSEFHCV